VATSEHLGRRSALESRLIYDALRGGFMRIRGTCFLSLAVSALLFFHGPALLAQQANTQQKVALTFDDLPAHGDVPAGLTRAEIARRILATLKAHNVPQAYGFINAGKLEKVPEDKEVLRLWRAAGYPLANHTYTHMDLATNSADAFEANVAADEPMLKQLMATGDWRWFRYPFLREGETPEKHNAVREFLLHDGYNIAQVTLDFEDYAWNGPYARCLAKNDTQGLQWLEDSYMATASEYLDLGVKEATLIFGRKIPHVLLLHIGGFETVMLPRLLDLLKQKGFVIVTLKEAESDAVYKVNPQPLQVWDGTLLDQIMDARKLQYPPHQQKPMDKLAAICGGTAASPPTGASPASQGVR
jgi:peptidoglycan/xylan/chitin deacetylase (PgdA/CDA1 family)